MLCRDFGANLGGNCSPPPAPPSKNRLRVQGGVGGGISKSPPLEHCTGVARRIHCQEVYKNTNPFRNQW